MQKVYVITVCRNAKALIEETIQSVLAQTYGGLQYIIIDGASTDGTVEIINKYRDRLSCFISEPDRGIYDAMNKGLAAARNIGSGWVNFMNAGDTFADNNVLTDVMAFIQHQSSNTNHPKILGGNTVNVFPDGHEEIHHAESSSVIPQRLPFSHQACIASIDFDWNFNTNYKYSADYEFLYKTYWAFGPESIITIDRPIARYRQEDSLSMVNANRVKGEYLSIQASHRTWQWWKEYLKWRLL